MDPKRSGRNGSWRWNWGTTLIVILVAFGCFSLGVISGVWWGVGPRGVAVPIAIPAAPRPTVTRSPTILQKVLEPRVLESPVRVTDAGYRVTESNPTWWKFAWKMTVENQTAKEVWFDARVKFLDTDGFIVDEDTTYGLSLAPHEERTFTGYDLIRTDVAPDIVQAAWELRQ